MKYEDVVAWFTAKENVYSLGLKRMQQACCLFGNIEKSIPCVHVGGTNGKGSTCCKIAKAFELAGYKTGLYTSPHISSICERIQINGVAIPEEELARLITLVLERDKTLSVFEVVTLAAFLWFKEQHVDIAIIEVGLGGRLDATNVCCPDLSVITSISLDHTEILGNTLQAIASEKAGIIKAHTPVVIGPRVPYDVIALRAVEEHAPLYRVQKVFSDYDEENSAIAAMALSLLKGKWPRIGDVIHEAIRARPSCRFEEIEGSPHIVLDVAHNPDGIERLIQKLGEKKAVFLCSFSSNKDIRTMVSSILASAEAIFCTQAPGERAMGAEALGKITLDLNPTIPVRIEKDVKKALQEAVCEARKKRVSLVVTGTFYLMDGVTRVYKLGGII